MSPGEPYFHVELDAATDPVQLTAHGELDAASAVTLTEKLGQAHQAAKGIELHLGGVTFIDSSGLRVIAAELSRAHSTGLPFSVASASDPVRRIFEVTGFTDVITS